MNRYEFFGFLSYSTKNRPVALEVRRRLEAVRIPSDLIVDIPNGLDSAKHIRPIFIDEYDLGLDASVKRSLDVELAKSAFLIVLCSPEAAESEWVAGEIETFIRLGRRDRILLLLIDGEPKYKSPEDPLGAFPNALMGTSVLGERDERLPKAAIYPGSRKDKRGGKKDKEQAIGLIAAKMLNLSPDLLIRRREKEARRLKRIASAMVAGAVSLFFGILTFQWHQTEIARELKDLHRSYALAFRSQAILREDGDPSHAVIAALAALPDVTARKSITYVPHAEAALVAALNALDLKAVWNGHRGEITMIMPSRSGEKVVSASVDRTLRVWSTREPLQPSIFISGHDSRVLAAVFALEDAVVVSGDEGGTVKVWDASTGLLIAERTPHQGPVIRLVASPDGRAVLTLSADGSAQILDLNTRSDVRLKHIHDDWRIYAGWGGKSGQPWSERSKSTGANDKWGLGQPTNRAYRGIGVTAGQWSPDGQMVVTTGQDGQIRFWSREGAEVNAISVSKEPIFDLLADFDRDLFVVGTTKIGSIWSIVGEKIAELSTEMFSVPQSGTTDLPLISLVRASKEVIVGQVQAYHGQGTQTYAWSLLDGSWVGKPHHHEQFQGPINHIASDSSSGIVVDGVGAIPVDSPVVLQPTRNVRNVVRVSSGGQEPSKVLIGHEAAVTAVAVIPGSSKIASGDQFGQVRLWDLAGKSPVNRFAASSDPRVGILAAAGTRDGRWLGAVSSNGVASIARVDDGFTDRQTLQLHQVQITEVDSGSAGERAGLRPGDRIVSIDDVSIDHRATFLRIVRENPGKQLKFLIHRDGRSLDIYVTPTARNRYSDSDLVQNIGVLGVTTVVIYPIGSESSAILFHPNDGVVFTGTKNGLIKAWRSPKTDRLIDFEPKSEIIADIGNEIQSLFSINSGKNILAISKSGKIVVIYIKEKTFKVMDIGISPNFYNLAPNEDILFTSNYSGQIKIIRLSDFSTIAEIYHDNWNKDHSAVFSENSNFVYFLSKSKSGSSQINEINLTNGLERHASIENSNINQLAYGGADRLFAASHTFEIFDIKLSDGTIIRKVPFERKEITRIEFDRRNNRLYAFANGVLRLFDGDSGVLLRELALPTAPTPLIAKIAERGDAGLVRFGHGNAVLQTKWPVSTRELVDKACAQLPPILLKRPPNEFQENGITEKLCLR